MMMFGSNASFDDGDLTAGPPPEGRRSIYEYVGPSAHAADSVRPQVDRKKRKSISSLLLVHPPKTVETSSPDAGGGTLVVLLLVAMHCLADGVAYDRVLPQ